jgi:hypothetical protein
VTVARTTRSEYAPSAGSATTTAVTWASSPGAAPSGVTTTSRAPVPRSRAVAGVTVKPSGDTASSIARALVVSL